MHSPFYSLVPLPPYCFTVILRLPPAKSKLFRPIKFDKTTFRFQKSTREQQPTFVYNNRAGSRRIPPYYINTLFRINLLYPFHAKDSHECTCCYGSTDNTSYVRSHCVHQKEVARICPQNQPSGIHVLPSELQIHLRNRSAGLPYHELPCT